MYVYMQHANFEGGVSSWTCVENTLFLDVGCLIMYCTGMCICSMQTLKVGGLLLDLCRKYPVFGCGLLDYVLYMYMYMQHANFEGGGSPLGPV